MAAGEDARDRWLREHTAPEVVVSPTRRGRRRGRALVAVIVIATVLSALEHLDERRDANGLPAIEASGQLGP
ncbi:MAG: hypothetical protein S0880_22185 [Actinomycetota bacterium]|nr:hypothetical protein [Actinomycetota bacterium]